MNGCQLISLWQTHYCLFYALKYIKLIVMSLTQISE